VRGAGLSTEEDRKPPHTPLPFGHRRHHARHALLAAIYQCCPRFGYCLERELSRSRRWHRHVTDGDFSGAPDPGGGLPTFGHGSVFAPDWVVTKRTIDLYGSTAWPNLDGLCSVDLDGTPGRGGIKHAAFTTTPGTAYNVTFVFSGNGACGPTVKTMKIKATGGQTTQLTWDISNGNDAQHDIFTQPTWQFSAKNSATTLSFTSLDTGHGNCGPVVTAISVNPASGARKR
jgi:Protein of unknown function (DUF642)